MKASLTNYKGIQFIQISSLPAEQRKIISTTINHKLIITILKETELLNDCLQYQHYLAWYENIYKRMNQEKTIEVSAPVGTMSLAFK